MRNPARRRACSRVPPFATLRTRAADRDPFLPRYRGRAAGGRRGWGGRFLPRRCLRQRDGRLDVLAGDRASRAGSGQPGQVDAEVLGQLADRRLGQDGDPAAGRAVGSAGLGRLGGHRFWAPLRRVAVASAVMGLAVLGVSNVSAATHGVALLGRVVASIVVGVLVFTVTISILGARAHRRDAARRRRPPPVRGNGRLG